MHCIIEKLFYLYITLNNTNMKVLKKDYSVDFKHYGIITVPKGTTVTHQTAMGIDPKYHFVNDFSWVSAHEDGTKQFGLLHDLKYSGINVPIEYIEEKLNAPYNYYADELVKVSGNSEYPKSIQIKSDDKSTKWLSLNDESATELVKFLTQNYKVKL